MNLEYEKCSISVVVEYVEEQSIEEVVSIIKGLSSPHIFVWYIGAYGLKRDGVEFYKNCLISPVLEQQELSTFWLVDLTAWGTLRDSRGGIHLSSSFCKTIEDRFNPRIRCIRSSETFEKMQKITDELLIEYFRNALSREFIHLSSVSAKLSNITIGEIFDFNCPILGNLYNFDTARAYSILQYLEGCLLVDEIVKGDLYHEKIEIVFAIPNDEAKFYKDATNAFQKDVEFLLNRRYGSMMDELDVTVRFLSFKYGDNVSERPYNFPGKAFKKNEFRCDDIVDSKLLGDEK